MIQNLSRQLYFVSVKVGVVSGNEPKMVTTRDYKHFKECNFLSDLQAVNWGEIIANSDPNAMWEKWKHVFINIIDKHAPFRTKKVKAKKSPWINKQVKENCLKRDKLKKIAIKSKNIVDWNKYKAARNKANNFVYKAKEKFYKSEIEKNVGNSKVLWKTINTVMHRKDKSNTIQNIKVHETTLTEPKDIAEHMNSFFTNIGLNLASQIENIDDIHFTDFITPSSSNFEFWHVTKETIFNIINCLESNKATGLDNIPIKLLKIAAGIVSDSLCTILNSSIECGVFPDELKLTKIIPIHKSGDKDIDTNYRPISITSVVAKVFEKAVCSQLTYYLTENDLLSKHQSGFRKNHSTTTALLEATTEWLRDIDNHLYNIVVFLDLAKAFDTVNHQILLKKLELYGIKGNILTWIKSFLTNRQQLCDINGSQSKFSTLKCGIPQGSILGPLLFLVYINDLPSCLKHTNPYLFADDTSLSKSGKSMKAVELCVNADVESIRKWLSANKLSINVGKTEYMIIGSPYQLDQMILTPEIKLGNKILERVFKTKSLGLIIDDSMTWNEQIVHIIKKVNTIINGMKQIKPFVQKSVLELIYKSMVQPYFDYCDVVWGNFTKELETDLQRSQNRAARVITNSDFSVHTKDLLQSLGWLDLASRRLVNKMSWVYKSVNNLTPKYFNELFTGRDCSQSYILRNSDINLTLAKPNTEYLKRSFQYDGAKSWNELPNDIKKSTNVKHFKTKLTNYIRDPPSTS